ncbi:MAG: restriction endonuclease subunit S [Bacteroidetes bacterium]|nr:restriction endonuclease subunit S [Bacteroidota bacterium]
MVASSGNSYGKVAVVQKRDLPLVMNTSVIRFKALPLIDYNYLLIFLKSNLFKDQIDLLITGGAQPNFGPIHLRKIIIDLPPNTKDQAKISSVICEMDLVIERLEFKLEKFRQLKQGMMQNLLTVKIRLI